MQLEADRRQNLVDDLVTREKHLNATFRGEVKEEPSRYAKSCSINVKLNIFLQPQQIFLIFRR